MKCMGKSALYLWCAGLALITFDLILTFEFGGFTIKSYYFLFLAAASLFALEEIRGGRVWDRARELFRRPWVFAFLLFAYELGMSPFSYVPKKSFAYSVWLLFDIAVIAIPGYFIIRKQGALGRRAVVRTLLLSAVFLVAVLLVDLLAFQHGYIGGLIGFNQELSLKWGMSRAHAFAFEPSYLSLFFTFSLLLLLGQFFSSRRSVGRLPIGIASFALLVGIFLLGSRTGWVLTALGIAAMLLSLGKKIFRRDILLSAAGALLLFGIFVWVLPGKQFALMKQNLVGTLLSGTDGSSNTRVASMIEGVRTGVASRGLGVGVGASFVYYITTHPEVITPYLNLSSGSESIMSTWGQVVAESGLPGFLLYLGFGASVIWSAFRAARANPDSIHASCLISAVLFFVLAAHLVGNVARSDVWVWFALWAVFTAEFRERAPNV